MYDCRLCVIHWYVEVPYLCVPRQMLTSYLILLAIVIVLATFDQQQLPNWPLKVSLNTFLAFLTIVAKAAFMFPDSVAISQTSWSWFSHSRPLYDFHLIDQASKGPLGSAQLAFRMRHKHFITLGALLSIVSVITSPITQLAISYPLRTVVGTEEALVSALQSLNHLTDDPGHTTSNAVVEASKRCQYRTEDFARQEIEPLIFTLLLLSVLKWQMSLHISSSMNFRHQDLTKLRW